MPLPSVLLSVLCVILVKSEDLHQSIRNVFYKIYLYLIITPEL